jgi:hypothetical protein
MTLMSIANNPVQAAQIQAMFLYSQTADYPPDSLAHLVQHSRQINEIMSNIAPVQEVVMPAFVAMPDDEDDAEVDLGYEEGHHPQAPAQAASFWRACHPQGCPGQGRGDGGWR